MPEFSNHLASNEFISTGTGSDGAESKHSTLPSSVALIPHALSDHTDVAVTVPSLNDVLYWNGVMWAPTPPSTVVSFASLADLSDVSASPSPSDCLCWNGASWIAIPPSTIAAGMSLGDISDVDVAGVSTDDCLCWNGSEWTYVSPADIVANSNLALADLSDVSGLVPSLGWVLRWNGSEWTPTNPDTVVGDGIDSILLDELSNVDVPSPSIGQCLCFDGADWVASDSSSSGIAEPLETIRGTVGFAGTVDEGVGWSVAKPSTGVYQVTFTTPFSSIPSVVAVGNESQAAPAFTYVICIISNVTISGFSVQTSDWRGAPTEFFQSDQTWYFIAMGAS